ncbi:prepilin-type N-terminal cleavage/methylation domain-containing protein, partial [Patescibacteria group bacterium]|nr:prepilin-type N-terminal cleavage/methylation domain-containing protein [Patescibacteria group bacterium]
MRIKNKKNLELKFSDGFTLIEVMAAVAVLSIGLIGGLTVITKNLSIISGGEDRIIAANLAAEGIELVRNVRDTNWL